MNLFDRGLARMVARGWGRTLGIYALACSFGCASTNAPPLSGAAGREPAHRDDAILWTPIVARDLVTVHMASGETLIGSLAGGDNSILIFAPRGSEAERDTIPRVAIDFVERSVDVGGGGTAVAGLLGVGLGFFSVLLVIWYEYANDGIAE